MTSAISLFATFSSFRCMLITWSPTITSEFCGFSLARHKKRNAKTSFSSFLAPFEALFLHFCRRHSTKLIWYRSTFRGMQLENNLFVISEATSAQIMFFSSVVAITVIFLAKCIEWQKYLEERSRYRRFCFDECRNGDWGLYGVDRWKFGWWLHRSCRDTESYVFGCS